MMTDEILLQKLKENPFVLAPMAGVTDLPFRTFMREQGCSIVITELVSANGLKYSSDKTKKLMEYEEVQRPIGVQLFGETPEIIAEGAKYVQEMGADFVDLNFGCPVKKVVKKGAGSAVLKDLVHLRKILRAVKGAIDIPLTIKIRTGWDAQSRNADQVAQVAHDEGIAWVAIHGRTRAAAYTGEADWDYIAEVKATSPLPILGNGDLTSAEKAVGCMKSSDVDGVMIGRGCLKNPYIFKESLQLLRQEEGHVSRNYPEIFNQLHGHLTRLSDERGTLIQLRKFASWFSAGYPGSAGFRKALFTAKEVDEVVQTSRDYFGQVQKHLQADTSHEAFMMSGHG